MDSLARLSADLMKKYEMDIINVVPHNSIDATQCPGSSFPMREFMDRLELEVEGTDNS